MLKENDVIVATRDLTSQILKGTKGVIMSVYNGGRFFLVEFIDNNGNTIGNGMDTVSIDDIELAHLRR